MENENLKNEIVKEVKELLDEQTMVILDALDEQIGVVEKRISTFP